MDRADATGRVRRTRPTAGSRRAQRRRCVARTDRSGSAGRLGETELRRSDGKRRMRLETPLSAALNGWAERQMGTSIFSSQQIGTSIFFVSKALILFPRRCAARPGRLFPVTRASRPGLHAAAADAAGPRNRAIRLHGSCGCNGPRPADAAYGRIPPRAAAVHRLQYLEDNPHRDTMSALCSSSMISETPGWFRRDPGKRSMHSAHSRGAWKSMSM